MCRHASVALLTVLLGGVCAVAHAQAATYYLHTKVSSFNRAFDQLKTAIPDATSIAIASRESEQPVAGRGPRQAF
jgi:hypothetical protein